MRLVLNNLTQFDIAVCCNQMHFLLQPYQSFDYEYVFDDLLVVLSFVIVSCNDILDKTENCCLNVSSHLTCTMHEQTEARVTIGYKTKEYQNYTQYTYLTFATEGLDIVSSKRSIDLDDNNKKKLLHTDNTKKRIFVQLLKKSIVDALIDGTLMFIVIAWVISVRVAWVVLLSVFVIAFVVNFIMFKLSKSKKRWLNWIRDSELPDDMEYLLKNIDKFCD